MSENLADIVGTKGANFTFTISAGTILNEGANDGAYLEVTGQPNVSLTVAGNRQEVTIPNLPKGDSTVRLDMAWAPEDPDATIDVGTVTAGTVNAANPKHWIDSGKEPGYVTLFGK